MANIANPEHLAVLKQGVEVWNAWREEHPKVIPVLTKASLYGADLAGVNLARAILYFANLQTANLNQANLAEATLNRSNLFHANLAGANLSGAELYAVDLTEANLAHADLSGAKLLEASLIRADLTRANLMQASLIRAEMLSANLTGANLSEANLFEAALVRTNLQRAVLNGCHIYGIAAWSLKLEGAEQSNLIITDSNEPTITVDNLEVAQFIYLLLNNQKVRHIIDSVTSKVVLILGRFTDERKAVLDAIRKELRRRDLTPILFDFDRPASKDLTGTVETLARLARFVIADLTDPSSIPHELATIVPSLRTTPVLPIRLAGGRGYGMFEDLQRSYSWVLEIREYKDCESLILAISDLIAPANEMVERLRNRL